jgi:pimeloyl-ACP methyl ester carboxylesterase
MCQTMSGRSSKDTSQTQVELMQNPPTAPKTIFLSEGRRLAYSEYGDSQGKPVFFFHGWPGARLQGQLSDASARKLRMRMIAPDRPGFGFSEFQPRRAIRDWPKDIAELADQLGFPRFAVLGLSGGAPYALACAHEIPHRCTAVGIISGIGTIDSPRASEGVSPNLKRMVLLTKNVPWLVKLLLWRSSRLVRRDPEAAFEKLIATLPEPDRSALLQPGIKDKALQARIDSFQSGSRGHLWEMKLFTRPWGFRREAIQMPIHLWHGDQDEEIFLSTAQDQADAIQDCQVTFLPHEGHYSLYINHIENILKEIREQN